MNYRNPIFTHFRWPLHDISSHRFVKHIISWNAERVCSSSICERHRSTAGNLKRKLNYTISEFGDQI